MVRVRTGRTVGVIGKVDDVGDGSEKALRKAMEEGDDVRFRAASGGTDSDGGGLKRDRRCGFDVTAALASGVASAFLWGLARECTSSRAVAVGFQEVGGG